ncbi:MAG TPA: hypothetical protein VFS60_14310, partial [Thermoanaerobaculia bacterium]|nr:hypothetical protein [Thermoanaerobaculia bacterium]
MAVRRDDRTLAELAELLDVLRSSSRKLDAGEGAELGRKATALRPLWRELERRERAAASSQLGASPWQPAAGATRLDSDGGATCADALVVGDGQFAAAVVPTGGAGAGELWLRYDVPAGDFAVVSTAGSDFDTVVDVFESCPAAGSTAAAHGDDEVGLQARAAFRAAAGTAWWIRIRGWEGAAGMAAIDLASGASGFAGAVSDEISGQPVYR